MVRLIGNPFVQISICVLTLGFGLAAAFTHAWASRDYNTLVGAVTSSVGLWLDCPYYTNVCMTFTATSDWLRSCRSMAILSNVCQLISVAFSVVIRFNRSNKKIHCSLIASCFLAALSMFVCVLVFVTLNTWTHMNLYAHSWSFILACVNLFLCMCSGVYACLTLRTENKEPIMQNQTSFDIL